MGALFTGVFKAIARDQGDVKMSLNKDWLKDLREEENLKFGEKVKHRTNKTVTRRQKRKRQALKRSQGTLQLNNVASKDSDNENFETAAAIDYVRKVGRL